jgi:hypothetical protein
MSPDYLSGYPADVIEKAQQLQERGLLLARLEAQYPESNAVANNGMLHAYVQDLKRTWMKSSPPLGKVRYCDKISTLNRALGLHSYVVRQQGRNFKRKNELRVASVFKQLPAVFLRMIVVHELAHLRHKDHDKAFYRLCEHMEPDYHRLEFDLRLLLYARQATEAYNTPM